MVPSVSAKYASLHESVVDDSGNNYTAKLVDGKMTWVFNENSGCPTIAANIMSVGDILTGNDNNEYIVMMSNNTKYWSLKKKKSNKTQTKSKDQSEKSIGCPLISANIMSVGDVLVGTDGNEYVVKLINGEKQYVIHQKIYKWSQTGVMYKTVDSSTSADCGYSPSNSSTSKYSKSKLSKTKSTKSNNK